MTTIRKQYLFIAACLLLAACTDENTFGTQFSPDLSGHYLQLSSSSVSLGSAAQSKSQIEVSSVGTAWQFNGMDAWLTVEPSAGGGNSPVTLTATENTSGSDARTSVFTFCSTDAAFDFSRQVSVTQAHATPFVRPSETALSFAAVGGTQTVSLTANIPISLTNSAGAWLTTQLSADQHTLTVTATENTTSAERSASIGLGADVTIRVVQAKPSTPVATPGQLEFPNTGGAYQLNLSSEVSWTATTSQSWLNVSPSSDGAGAATLTVEATPNTSTSDRPGFVYINIGSQQVLSVSVKQQGHYLSVTPSTESYTIPSTGGQHEVHIYTNDPWTATSTSTWLQLSQRSGAGGEDIDITMTIPDNASIHSREDQTTFHTAYHDDITITTTQAGRYLTADATSLFFFAKGGTSDVVTITTDATYTITSSDTSWLTVSQQGNAFTATAAQNTTGADREATITIAMTNLQEGEAYAIELPVKQYYLSPGIDVTPYDSDEPWDIQAVHEWVDLGLSVCWATTNVGAATPDDYGDYFAWGETTAKTIYDWSTYKYCNGSSGSLTKYNDSSVDINRVLEAADDAATAKWGGKWRMPTYDEVSELCTKCTWTWTTQNSNNGYLVTGPNGKSIFLPAAGYRSDSSLSDDGSRGNYWSSSLNTNYPYQGFGFVFGGSDYTMYSLDRYKGRSVRPVIEP